MTEVYKNSELCQQCAECCKVFRLTTNSKAEALRFALLDIHKISVKKIKDSLWMITFHFPCSKLTEENGKYCCEIYKGDRPEFCKIYPMNMIDDKELMEWEKEFCPALKEEAGK